MLLSLNCIAEDWHFITALNPFEGKPVNLLGQIDQKDVDTLNAGYDKAFFVRIDNPTSWDPIQGFYKFGTPPRDELKPRGDVLYFRSVDIMAFGTASKDVREKLVRFWESQ